MEIHHLWWGSIAMLNHRRVSAEIHLTKSSGFPVDSQDPLTFWAGKTVGISCSVSKKARCNRSHLRFQGDGVLRLASRIKSCSSPHDASITWAIPQLTVPVTTRFIIPLNNLPYSRLGWYGVIWGMVSLDNYGLFGCLIDTFINPHVHWWKMLKSSFLRIKHPVSSIRSGVRSHMVTPGRVRRRRRVWGLMLALMASECKGDKPKPPGRENWDHKDGSFCWMDHILNFEEFWWYTVQMYIVIIVVPHPTLTHTIHTYPNNAEQGCTSSGWFAVPENRDAENVPYKWLNLELLHPSISSYLSLWSLPEGPFTKFTSALNSMNFSKTSEDAHLGCGWCGCAPRGPHTIWLN